MKLPEKIIISVLSTLIFSLSLAFLEYIPVTEQQTGVAYFSFKVLVIIYVIFSLPVYLIGGGLYSYFVDVYFDKVQFRNKFLKYLIEFLVYAAGGLLIVGVLLAIILLVDGSIAGILISKFFIVGALASLLFYHISLVSKKALKFVQDKL